MQENIWLYLLFVGVVIIIGLAAYAGKLLYLVSHQKNQQQAAQQKLQEQLYANDVKVYESVIIITRAMKEEQCDYSEGSWRISVLLDSLQTANSLDQKFPAIFELYRGIKHLSILKDRKALTKAQRMKEDVERMKIEAKCYDHIVNDLDNLLAYANEQIQVLSTPK